MPKLSSRIGRATRRAVDAVELQLLAFEGRRSLKSKAAKVKRVAKKALKAGAIAGAVAVATTVLREGRKRRALET
jgi:hypothetical protein